MDNASYMLLARHVVGTEVGERLLKRNPNIKYSEALKLIGTELEKEFRGYEFRMEEYVNKMIKKNMDELPGFD